LPAPLTVRVDSSAISYGDPAPSFTSKITGYQYQDNVDSVFSDGTISYNLLNSSGTQIPAVNIPAGKLDIVPTGNVIQPSNYTIEYVNGLLTVNPTVLTATPVDTFRIYGDDNPEFRIIYSGFLNGDGPGDITPPTASTAASNTSNVGTYPITLSGGSSANYTIVNNSGTLTIKPATLTVKADDKTICLFERLPTFTSTITGFKNDDANNIICGPYYKVSSALCSLFSGNYTITPYGLQLSDGDNYHIVYKTGTLHVVFWPKYRYREDSAGLQDKNPKGQSISLKDIQGIDQLATGQPTLSYQNPDRAQMIANLSKRLDNNIIITSAYPNPTSGKVTLQVSDGTISPNGITINDAIGRTYSCKLVKISTNRVELDLSGLRTGVYFIKVKVGEVFKTFRIIKQ
jgi:hypothetical protein